MYMVYSDQPSFHKVLTHIFVLDLELVQNLVLHDLINCMEDLDIILVCDTEENKDKNELYLLFLEEHISSDDSELKKIDRNPGSGLHRNPNQTSMPIYDSTADGPNKCDTMHAHFGITHA